MAKSRNSFTDARCRAAAFNVSAGSVLLLFCQWCCVNLERPAVQPADSFAILLLITLWRLSERLVGSGFKPRQLNNRHQQLNNPCPRDVADYKLLKQIVDHQDGDASIASTSLTNWLQSAHCLEPCCLAGPDDS